MQAVWIKRPNSAPSAAGERGVLVFAAGWAGSDELVRHAVLPEGWDFLCLFDYRDLPKQAELDTLYELLAPYRERRLAAWSFGVWAAEQVFGPLCAMRPGGFWSAAVAIGGTPAPIHDRYGIPARAFAVTVRSIGGAGTTRFLERMCGTPEVLREYYRHRSTRPLEEIYDELVSLQRQALSSSTADLLPEKGLWTTAIVGGRDAIFPPENMERYWNEAGVPVSIRPAMPHYPLCEPELWRRIITDEAR